MKRVIRYGIWESNSSSSHSLSVSRESDVFVPNYIQGEIDTYDNKLHVNPSEFGWEWERCDDFMTKLQYALEMVYETEVPGNSWRRPIDETLELFYNTDGFDAINRIIKEEFDCDGVVFEVKEGVAYPFGYIDHQSCEDYGSLQDFLDDYGVDLYRFLFDRNVVLKTGNDNG